MHRPPNIHAYANKYREIEMKCLRCGEMKLFISIAALPVHEREKALERTEFYAEHIDCQREPIEGYKPMPVPTPKPKAPVHTAETTKRDNKEVKTKKRYEVCVTEALSGYAYVEATSAEEAEEIAQAMLENEGTASCEDVQRMDCQAYDATEVEVAQSA